MKIFVDTERNQNHKIIQMGLACFDDEGILVDTFQTNVNTGVKLDNNIMNITGITNEELAIAPKPLEALSNIQNFFSKHTDSNEVICYAWGDDKRYINDFYTSNGLPVLIETIDIQKETSRRILGPHCKRHLGLSLAADILQISFDQVHNALDDAIFTGHVFFTSFDERKTLDVIDYNYFKSTHRLNRYLSSDKKLADIDKFIAENKKSPRFQRDMRHFVRENNFSDINSLMERIIHEIKIYNRSSDAIQVCKLTEIDVLYSKLIKLLMSNSNVFSKKKLQSLKEISFDLLNITRSNFYDKTKENFELLSVASELESRTIATKTTYINDISADFLKDWENYISTFIYLAKLADLNEKSTYKLKKLSTDSLNLY